METIKLDLVPGKKMASLHASQFDDGRTHGIDLYENGIEYKLDGTELLTINERKGDDCICSLDIENTFTGSNHIVFASTEQMCAVAGANICELVIAKGETTIGTLNFILEIEPSPTEGGIESDSEIKNLKRQIEAITEEVIGDDYYTAEQTDEAIATATEGKADTTYVNTELAKKADKNNTYTKTQVDSALNNKMDMTNPTGLGAVSIGRKAETTIGADSFSVGWNTEASSSNAFASGQETVASGANSNAEGYKTLASGYGAHAENRQTTASGDYSHAEGWSAVSSGSSSHAEGQSSESSGTSAHAEGYQTIASNDSSHAEGCQTTASGKQSHAEGYQTIASGKQSHTEGYKTTANDYSHAEGVRTNASGTYSHAEGYLSGVSGDAAHAEGWSTNASGLCAHTEGRSTTASGTYSSAIGYQTIANHKSQHTFGEFNIEDSSTLTAQSRGNYVEIVGNGTDDNNRSNARTLDWQGNEVLAGNLTFNGNKSLTSEISRLDGRIDNLPADTNTWRAIKVNGVEKLGNDTSSGAVEFEDSARVKFEYDTNGNKIRAKLDGIYTESEVDDLLDEKADKSNTYTKEQVDDIVYNILPDDTASGSVANFNTSLALPIKSLEVDVNAVQAAGTPTPTTPLPISGVSKISVVQTGTNIWNGITEVGSFDTTTGEKVTNSNLLRSVNPIPVKPNATYMRLIDASLGFRVFYYDKNMNFLSTEVSQYTQLAITIPNDCYYMNIACQKAIASVSINYPPTDTSFRAYNPNGTTEAINLGGTYYGGHFTQDKDGHRQFVVTHHYATLNDDSVWQSTTGTVTYYYNYAFTDRKLFENSTAGLICSAYPIGSSNGFARWQSATGYHFGINDNTVTLDDIKALARNGDIAIVYEIANPIIIDLPDGTPIITLNGTNNIYADTGDSTVVFKSSVNDYVSAHSGGNLLGMGGVYLGGAKSGGGEEEPDEGEDTEKTKEIDEPKEEIKTIGDTKKLGGE